MTLKEKYVALRDFMSGLGSCVVAFSGGVDSSLVAKAAFDALGRNAVAVTVKSETMPDFELECAVSVAGEIGIRHVVVRREALKSKAFTNNPVDRCYLCKKDGVKILRDVAREYNFKFIVDGTNADDLADSGRTGLLALEEEGVVSPLALAGLVKQDVVGIAREVNLPNAGKPPFSCLATRIPFGEEITPGKLAMVERAEEFIKNSGVMQVRVRLHDGTARIEVPDSDFGKIIKNRGLIVNEFKNLGFNYITLDLEGYKIKNRNNLH